MECPASCKHLIDDICTVSAGNRKARCPYEDAEAFARMAKSETYLDACLLERFGRRKLKELGYTRLARF